MTKPKFDYSTIPAGYYHRVMQTGNPIRRAWHRQKFQRVIDCLPIGNGLSIIDVGCFAGTFLSLVSQTRFIRQVGVDVLKPSIEEANQQFGNDSRQFLYFPSIALIDLGTQRFDCVTIIEVIEHLAADEIDQILGLALELLKPGGKLILTTPNYASTWPVLEILINRISDLSYEEQHITKFNYFTIFQILRKISPRVMGHFSPEFKTTTHFISPFLAHLSLGFSARLSSLLGHRTWCFPFGNLILISLIKK